MDAWPRCLERLEAELPAEDVHTWLKPLQAGMRDDGFVLYAPNAFVMEEVRDRYLIRIRELLAHFAGNPEVSLEIGAMRRPMPMLSGPVAAPSTTTARVPNQPPFQGNLDSHYTFDNFVEGRSN
ncbi:MAG: DnaA N-terminal domain-containing protein, partial [Luteimonas sp.]